VQRHPQPAPVGHAGTPDQGRWFSSQDFGQIRFRYWSPRWLRARNANYHPFPPPVAGLSLSSFRWLDGGRNPAKVRVLSELDAPTAALGLGLRQCGRKVSGRSGQEIATPQIDRLLVAPRPRQGTRREGTPQKRGQVSSPMMRRKAAHGHDNGCEPVNSQQST
jgi:hypothetical protein